jgi:hypothetical protein
MSLGKGILEVREMPRCPAEVDSRDLDADCYESAATPGELFEKLDQLRFDTIVMPHGNTWGCYTPPGSTLEKQLTAQQNDPSEQLTFEIMPGHGNSEEYRAWRATDFSREFTAAGRDTVYYVRAIEEPSSSVNAGHLRRKYDESGNCLEVDPCYGDYRTDSSDDCTTPIEERAWSSPIYVDAAGSR